MAVGLALQASPALAGKPHTHGTAEMAVTVEAGRLTVEIEMPLDTLVGFEHVPRSDAQRQAAGLALRRLRESGDSLLRPDPSAQCRLTRSAVDAPVLEHGVAPVGGHAQAQARYEFSCARPDSLLSLETGLFDAFGRLQRLQAQWATPAGQGRQVLRRGAKVLRLQR